MSLSTTTTTIMPWLTMDGKQFYKLCKGRWADRRCFSCGWFGHLACNCRNRELRAIREKRSDKNKNRWEVLRSCVMRCGVKSTVHPIKGNAQQGRKCWGCSEVGHYLGPEVFTAPLTAHYHFYYHAWWQIYHFCYCTWLQIYHSVYYYWLHIATTLLYITTT